MKKLNISLFLILFVNTIISQAEDRLNLDGTAIIGNQELPKVLYIVPWKKSEVPDMNQPPLESLIDEALQPIDREVFRRQVNYYHALHDKPESSKK
ncbi:hypothetical protein MNBD_GAMMA23-227 [hydrothermal vent metagenome]|uniref:Uncharacterized protein n=1 Tax=hydrothermal vent metagenome TaxID=652676 RepID=A0A3B0ZXL4_9ZZZZ